MMSSTVRMIQLTTTSDPTMSDSSKKILYVHCTYGSFLLREYTDTLAYTSIPMGSLFKNSGEHDGPRLKTNWVSSVITPKIFDEIDSFFHENNISLNDPAFLSRIHCGIFATNQSVDGEQLLKNIQQLLIFSLLDNMEPRLSISALGTLLRLSYSSPECEGVVVQLRFHGRLATKFGFLPRPARRAAGPPSQSKQNLNWGSQGLEQTAQ